MTGMLLLYDAWYATGETKIMSQNNNSRDIDPEIYSLEIYKYSSLLAKKNCT